MSHDVAPTALEFLVAHAPLAPAAQSLLADDADLHLALASRRDLDAELWERLLAACADDADLQRRRETLVALVDRPLDTGQLAQLSQVPLHPDVASTLAARHGTADADVLAAAVRASSPQVATTLWHACERRDVRSRLLGRVDVIDATRWVAENPDHDLDPSLVADVVVRRWQHGPLDFGSWWPRFVVGTVIDACLRQPTWRRSLVVAGIPTVAAVALACGPVERSDVAVLLAGPASADPRPDLVAVATLPYVDADQAAAARRQLGAQAAALPPHRTAADRDLPERLVVLAGLLDDPAAAAALRQAERLGIPDHARPAHRAIADTLHRRLSAASLFDVPLRLDALPAVFHPHLRLPQLSDDLDSRLVDLLGADPVRWQTLRALLRDGFDGTVAQLTDLLLAIDPTFGPGAHDR